MEQRNKILISVLVVVAVALIIFNFENITGQPVIKGNTRMIEVSPSTTVYKGEQIEITVKPVSGVMSVGGVGVGKERLWLKGSGGLSFVKDLTNYKCVDGWTNKCKEARVGVSFSPGWTEGIYEIVVEKTLASGTEVLGKRRITYNNP